MLETWKNYFPSLKFKPEKGFVMYVVGQPEIVDKSDTFYRGTAIFWGRVIKPYGESRNIWIVYRQLMLRLTQMLNL